jgi:hypothetical protein
MMSMRQRRSGILLKIAMPGSHSFVMIELPGFNLIRAATGYWFIMDSRMEEL